MRTAEVERRYGADVNILGHIAFWIVLTLVSVGSFFFAPSIMVVIAGLVALSAVIFRDLRSSPMGRYAATVAWLLLELWGIFLY